MDLVREILLHVEETLDWQFDTGPRALRPPDLPNGWPQHWPEEWFRFDSSPPVEASGRTRRTNDGDGWWRQRRERRQAHGGPGGSGDRTPAEGGRGAGGARAREGGDQAPPDRDRPAGLRRGLSADRGGGALDRPLRERRRPRPPAGRLIPHTPGGGASGCRHAPALTYPAARSRS